MLRRPIANDDYSINKYIVNRLYNVNEIPEWYRHNEFVTSNYRPWNKSYKYYIKSMFKLHNEFFNIWTHLIAFLFYMCCIFVYNWVTIKDLIPIYNNKNTIITNIYMGTAALCFFCSTIMHTIYPKSHRVCCNSCTMDYIGITLLISGSYSPFIYYLFYCNEQLEYIYIIVLNSLALINIGISFLSFMHKAEYFRYKALVYIIYILSVVFPLINKFIKDDYKFHIEIIYDIKYYFLSLMTYLLAVFFYLTRFPESVFNINYIVSHSYFHFFSFIGSICILISIFEIQYLYIDINCGNETIVGRY